MINLGLFQTDLQVDLWDLDPGPFTTEHTEVKCMNANCTAAIGEPVRLQLGTKDAFKNLRRESCVTENSRESCSLNATLILNSADRRKSTISTKPGPAGQNQYAMITDTV